MTDARKSEIAGLEDDAVEQWIKDQAEELDKIVASLEEKLGVTVGDDVREDLAGLSGVNSGEFKAYATAIARQVVKPVEDGDGDDDKKSGPSGL